MGEGGLKDDGKGLKERLSWGHRRYLGNRSGGESGERARVKRMQEGEGEEMG